MDFSDLIRLETVDGMENENFDQYFPTAFDGKLVGEEDLQQVQTQQVQVQTQQVQVQNQQEMGQEPPKKKKKQAPKRENPQRAAKAPSTSKASTPPPPAYNMVHNIIPSSGVGGKVLNRAKSEFVAPASPPTISISYAQTSHVPTEPDARAASTIPAIASMVVNGAPATPVVPAAPVVPAPVVSQPIQRESPTVSSQLNCLPTDGVSVQMGFHPATGEKAVVISQATQHDHVTHIYMKMTDIPAMIYTLVQKMMEN
jgi:hypothetical protein